MLNHPGAGGDTVNDGISSEVGGLFWSVCLYMCILIGEVGEPFSWMNNLTDVNLAGYWGGVKQTAKMLPILRARLANVIESIKKEQTRLKAETGGVPGAPGPEGGSPEVEESTKGYFERMKSELFSFHDARLEIMQAQQTLELEAEQEAQAGKEITTAEHFERMKELLFGYHDARLEIMQAQQTLELEAEEEKVKREIEIEKYRFQTKYSQAKNWLSFSITMAGALTTLAGRESATLFYISKAAAVAQATVSAFQAYGMALANPPGPPVTIPLAKTVLALGLANAAAIAATGIAGPSAAPGGGGGAVGTYPASPYTGAPVLPYEPEADEEKRGVININVYGDVLGDPTVVARLAEILTDGVENYDINLIATKTIG